LAKPDDTYPESLESMADRLLPALRYLKKTELDQIELVYLWFMISEYAKKHAQIVRITVAASYASVPTTEIRGFNQTQLNTIIDLFGYKPIRGEHFWLPVLQSAIMAMYLWHVPEVSETKQWQGRGWAAN